MPARKTLADMAPTPPVKVAAGAFIIPVEPLDVMDELRAAQVSEVLPPRENANGLRIGLMYHVE